MDALMACANASGSFSMAARNLSNSFWVILVYRAGGAIILGSSFKPRKIGGRSFSSVVPDWPFGGDGTVFSTPSNLNTTVFFVSWASTITPGRPFNFQGPVCTGRSGQNHTI